MMIIRSPMARRVYFFVFSKPNIRIIMPAIPPTKRQSNIPASDDDFETEMSDNEAPNKDVGTGIRPRIMPPVVQVWGTRDTFNDTHAGTLGKTYAYLGLGLSVKPSKIPKAGLGLYADRVFQSGDIITELCGHICRKENYRSTQTSTCSVRLSHDLVLDASSTLLRFASSVGHMINDSNDVVEPNAKFVRTSAFENAPATCNTGHLTPCRIWAVAIRPVRVHDEILIRYGGLFL
jgi:hypothetical protein